MSAPLGRIHAFELHEQPWFPANIRNALTEWLRVLWEYSRAEKVIAPLIQEAILASGAERIIDLCSGRSGPIIPVQEELARRGLRIPVTLTDKFPDRAAMSAVAAASGGKVTACLDSLDATNLPPSFIGFRTLFNSFHHFRPADALGILTDAFKARQPIGIFEITERSIPKLIFSFPASFLSCFVLIWRMRPRQVSWWTLTWLLPVIPFTIGWDGFVSHLRSYTEIELRRLTAGLSDEAYSWREGKVAAPRGGVTISFLIGAPTRGPVLPPR